MEYKEENMIVELSELVSKWPKFGVMFSVVIYNDADFAEKVPVAQKMIT